MSTTCVKETGKIYQTRPSAPYKAKNCMNEVRMGNDGREYISVPNVKGVYRWVPARKATTKEVKEIKKELKKAKVKKAKKAKKECRSDQYRNPKTGRCKKIAPKAAKLELIPGKKTCRHGTYLQNGSCKTSVIKNKDVTSRITVRARSDDGHHERERFSEYHDVSFSNPHFGKNAPPGGELFMFFDLDTSLFFRPFFEIKRDDNGPPTIPDDSLSVEDVEKYLATHKVWIVDGIPQEYRP